jgi:hypothetical protein
LKQALFGDVIIWYKKNNVSSSSKDNFTQAYEVILFLSKNEKGFTAMKSKNQGKDDRGRRNKTPPSHLVQYEPENRDKEKIVKILAIIHNAKSKTPIEELSTTSEISLAYHLPPV